MKRFFRRLFFQLRYLGQPPWDTGVSPPELVAFVESHPPGRALDLGCGTGTNVITLAQHGWQATGVDFVPRAVRQARRKARAAGVQVELRVGDVTQLEDLRAPFDLILDIGCAHALADSGRAAYRRNVERLLASGGTFLLYAFIRERGQEGPGLSREDIEAFTPPLELARRQDGTERGWRPSAWLTFVKPQG